MKKKNVLLKNRMISTALCASMILPGVMTSTPVWAGTVVPNGQDAEGVTMVWSSSFEDGEENLAKFKGTTVDETKGMQNIVAGIKQGLTGDVSYLVDLDSITGSADYNNNETKKQLFDGTSSTKFLTNENRPSEDTPVTVVWKLKDGGGEKLLIPILFLQPMMRRAETPKAGAWRLAMVTPRNGQYWIRRQSRNSRRDLNRKPFPLRIAQHIMSIVWSLRKTAGRA